MSSCFGVRRSYRGFTDRSIVPLLAFVVPICLAPIACSSLSRSGWQGQAANVNAITSEDQRVEYRYGDVPFKPYIPVLRTPAGVNVLRDAPHDHLHHHGIMYAVNVDGVEFWAETENAGRQVPGKTDFGRVVSAHGLSRSTITQSLAWRGPGEGQPILNETRVIENWTGGELSATLITWQSTLQTPADKGSVELSGRHYFGLGMRFIESMDTGGQFFNSEGAGGVEGTNNVRARWTAYTALADGKPVTVAVFDHPENLRHPATWFTMEKFAYISDTPDVHHAPITLQKDEPLTYRFGVALWDGHIDAAKIEKLYKRWIALPAQ